MFQVKEFLNYQDGGEECNKWLLQMKDAIEVVDIKYSVGVFQSSERYGSSQEFSGVLVIYKTK